MDKPVINMIDLVTIIMSNDIKPETKELAEEALQAALKNTIKILDDPTKFIKDMVAAVTEASE